MVNKTVFYTILVIPIIFIGCTEQTKESCENGKKMYKGNDINIVLTKKPYKNWYYFLEGINLNTGKDTFYQLEGRWYGQLEFYWDVGDTIIKKKGELFLEVHKRDTIHISEWRCDGILIDGVSVSELRKRKK